MKKENLELELYDSCLTLKNLAMVSGSKPFSGEFIYGMLMENAFRLRPVYREMLLLYRQGRDEEAFSYFAENRPETAGAVTADADGQHIPADIIAVGEKMCDTGGVVLGVRDFGLPEVPPRSRLGNRALRCAPLSG